MGFSLDEFDKAILRMLQVNADYALNDIAELVNLSRNACWRRIKRLEEEGFISARVALLNREKLNLGLKVLIAVRTDRHSADWLSAFHRSVMDLPEITEVLRTSGETDYMLIANVPDMKAYDELYQQLIQRIDISDVSSSFVMEEIKSTTALPLDYI
ncbi:MAG: Lrp/AsnC family transcriptional regulator [Hyphomicrobiales bacterium]